MHKTKIFLYLPLTIFITAIVFYPGISGDFIFDDYPNIVDNNRVHIQQLDTTSLKQAWASGNSGLLGRPVSMLSFALNYVSTGLDPYYFKLTNLIIHILVGLSLIFLSKLLLTAYKIHTNPQYPEHLVMWVSLAVGAIWLVHPLNLTTVLYPVQRMTSLSALFATWSLIFFISGRLQLDRYRSISFWILSAFVLLPLSILSKENGALTIFFIALIELTIFQLRTNSKQEKITLYTFLVLAVALPMVLAALYIVEGNWAANYSSRPFDLSQRLLTEQRVIWFYVKLIFFPNLNDLGLYHDDITVSKTLLDPINTLFCTFGIALITVLAVYFRKKLTIPSFGILFFLIGHSMESTFLPLDIAHEHRNYLPMYGLLFCAVFYILHPSYKSLSVNNRMVTFIVIACIFAMLSFIRAYSWKNPVDMAITQQKHHPSSSLANYDLALVYAKIYENIPENKETYYDLARSHFEKASKFDSRSTVSLTGIITLNYVAKKPFEESILNELNHRLENFPTSTDPGLVSLVNCHKQGICRLEEKWFKTTVNSALSNSSISTAAKVSVLFAWSDYLANIKGDYENAIKYANQIVELTPHYLQYRLNLITLCVVAKQHKLAQKHLAIMKQLDINNSYTDKIRQAESLILTILKE